MIFRPSTRAGLGAACHSLFWAGLLTLLAASAPAQESPAYQAPASNKLYGLNFSPNFGALEADAPASYELEQWLRIVAPYTDWIRTFDPGKRMEKAAEIAHSLNLKAAVGAWLGKERNAEEQQANERSVAQLIALGRQNQVDLAIVGSEVLLRGDLPPEQLLAYIRQVKAALPNIPVTTADTYDHLLEHPEILESIDIVFMNHYAYWESIPVEQAVPALRSAYQDLSHAAQGKPVIISESGWPSCGDTRGEAVASVENAKFYLLEFLAWARATQVKYFYFEAFDEPWKAAIEGQQGACWGLWDQNGSLKPGIGSVLGESMEAESVPDVVPAN
jgi:exo-beta-1,3-glucanase (GH17 family)